MDQLYCFSDNAQNLQNCFFRISDFFFHSCYIMLIKTIFSNYVSRNGTDCMKWDKSIWEFRTLS